MFSTNGMDEHIMVYSKDDAVAKLTEDLSKSENNLSWCFNTIRSKNELIEDLHGDLLRAKWWNRKKTIRRAIAIIGNHKK